ncbi:MAG: epimerase [Gammaproteobacteria bacterium]|nr:MAG: epimerase [Gammaproteobacteria bacterium]
MKIAVIGATGMIGHHTAKAVIAAGHQLFVVHRKSSRLDRIKDLDFTSAVADLDDRSSLTQALSAVDGVINCAAYYPTIPRKWQQDVAIATQQMENFYSACSQCDLKKIVYLGAAIALQKNSSGEPGHAELEYPSQPKNKNPYLQVKWALDKLAKQQAQQGLPVVIGIPSMTFGEFDYGPSTGQLIVGIANGSLPGFISGNRNTIYAGDAGRGLVLACEKGKVGERYLFTGSNITMAELVPLIAKVAGAATLKTVPLFVAKTMSKLQEFRYHWLAGPLPKVTSTAIAVISAGQFLDGTKAETDLGFKATLSVEQTIQKTYLWFKAQGYINT